jgi:hypothetical protein
MPPPHRWVARYHAGVPKWILRWLAVAFCVALTSGIRPWVDAASGAFIPADISQDAAAARLFARSVSPYGPVIRDEHSRMLGVAVNDTFPYFPHPPFSLIVSWPLGYVPFRTGAAMWFASTLAILLVLAALLSEVSRGERLDKARLAAPGRFFLLLLLWPPVLYNLEKGQWSILLAALVTAGYFSWIRGQLSAAAAWIATAAAVKVFPVIMGVYFLLRSRRAFAIFVAVGALLTGIPLLWIGLDAFAAFVGQSRLNMPVWESFTSVTFSLHGVLARLLIGGQWARPLIHAPVAARIIELVLVTLLLGVAVRLTWLARHGRANDSLALLAWVTLLPVLNPQSLGHNGALLALPLVAAACVLSVESSRWHRASWGISLVLVSVPKQTVWRLVSSPVEPWEGIGIVALPTWGSLLLFVVIVSLARQTARQVEVKHADGVW